VIEPTFEDIAKVFDELAAMSAEKRGCAVFSDEKVAAENHQAWFEAAAAKIRTVEKIMADK
jgi:hypothetical protein